ncbi:hypothetical protein CC79DRAFT_1393889 [Sarocladium strictum]
MTSVGDVLAILGLFERIAIELRNYKHAPAHFQNLGVELNLVQSTIRQILALELKDGVDRDTLQQIRAIALHCQPALQAFSEKMRTKESSLGALRSTKSLGSSIGKRLHWSMIEAKDVHELRQTVLAEMGAITILMSASQLQSIHRLSSQVSSIKSSCGSLERTCEDIRLETCSIAQIIAQTPNAFSELRRQSEEQHLTSRLQADALGDGVQKLQIAIDGLAIDTSSTSAVVRRAVQSMGLRIASLFEAVLVVRKLIVLLATYSAQLVVAVGRNTAMLLDMASQLKIITRAIENIPLHLTLPIVRLDDALGESWPLPFRACTTYNAFFDVLKCVVFANNRRGLTQVVNGQFSITLTGSGTNLNKHNWQRFAREGMHIKQAVIVSGTKSLGMDPTRCPYPGCDGILPMPDARIQLVDKECPTCGRWSKIRNPTHSITNMDVEPSTSEHRQNVIQPEPPSAQLSQDEKDWLYFTRIEVNVTHSTNTEPSNGWLPAAGNSPSYNPLTDKTLRDAREKHKALRHERTRIHRRSWAKDRIGATVPMEIPSRGDLERSDAVSWARPSRRLDRAGVSQWRPT